MLQLQKLNLKVVALVYREFELIEKINISNTAKINNRFGKNFVSGTVF